MDTGNVEINAVAELLAETRTVGYRPCFARAFGGAACAVLLSQFWFWTQTPTGQGAERDGWFWKSQRDITEETGLSRRETETARRKLRDLGVLQEDVRGIPGTLHFRLDAAALILRLQPCLERPAPQAETAPVPEFARNRQTSLHISAKLLCTNAPNQFARTRQTNSENTSESFQKNIRSQARPVLPAAWEKGPNPPAPFPVTARAAVSEDGCKEGGVGKEQRGGAALTPRQCQVNQQGTARFKEALRQARLQAAPPREPPGSC